MENGKLKALWTVAITAICLLALFSLYVLCLYGAIGGNEITKQEPFEIPSVQVISGDGSYRHVYQYEGTLAQLGISFVLLTYNLSFLFLAAFIFLVWLTSILSTWSQELRAICTWIKELLKRQLRAAVSP